MKIKCKFYGFPDIEKRIGGKEIETEIDGETIGDLQHHLESSYGEPLKKAFATQILKNGKEWIKMNDKNHSLKDGDRLSFLNMIAGG